MHNPNVSEEAKERSRNIVEGRGTTQTREWDSELEERVDGNVLRGHKVIKAC